MIKFHLPYFFIFNLPMIFNRYISFRTVFHISAHNQIRKTYYIDKTNYPQEKTGQKISSITFFLC